MVSQISRDILMPMVPELDPKRFTFIWGSSGDCGRDCPAEVTRTASTSSTFVPWMSVRYKSAGLSLSMKSRMLASDLLLCRGVEKVEFREGGYCTVTFRGDQANPDIIRNVLEQGAGRPVKFVPPSVQRTVSWVSARGIVEMPESFGRIAAFE